MGSDLGFGYNKLGSKKLTCSLLDMFFKQNWDVFKTVAEVTRVLPVCDDQRLISTQVCWLTMRLWWRLSRLELFMLLH